MSVQSLPSSAETWVPQSEAVTDDIYVQVEVMFVPERSVPRSDGYFFAYRVTIQNHSDQPVQLLRRRWIITDGNGMVHRVEGDGVVGEQPHLNPGDGFQYSSFCPLPTPYGTMEGQFEMQRGEDELFPVQVALFALNVPGGEN